MNKIVSFIYLVMCLILVGNVYGDVKKALEKYSNSRLELLPQRVFKPGSLALQSGVLRRLKLLSMISKITTIKLSTEVEAPILKAFEKCCVNKEELPGIYSLIRDGEVRDDPEFKKIIYCVWNDTGYIKTDGRLIIDKAAAVFPDKEVMVKILTECDKNIVAVDPVEIVYEGYKCFQEKSVYRIALAP